MSHDGSYPYATGDRLEERNTYFYSPYLGREFLVAWRRQRDDALAGCASAQDDAAPAPRPTDVLLETLHRDLAADAGTPLPLLDRLVQRFEVTKRLHGAYDARWRPVDAADYRRMRTYLRFAEVLDLAYARSQALPYLNALLKVVDTLTSRAASLTAEERALLAATIARERAHVAALVARLREDTHVA